MEEKLDEDDIWKNPFENKVPLLPFDNTNYRGFKKLSFIAFISHPFLDNSALWNSLYSNLKHPNKQSMLTFKKTIMVANETAVMQNTGRDIESLA